MSADIVRRAFNAGMAAALSLVAPAGIAATAAGAQAYPVRPIRLIIPFPPGGPRDVQARLIGPKLNEAWGQPVVIDNRAGANGIIGLDLAAKAPADGHTIVMISAGFAMAPALYAKLPYDTLRDFVPVAPLTSGPGIVVVHPALPAKSVRELIAYAKSRPGQLQYGSAGNGAPSHLAVELFKVMTQTDILHVPYKGMAPALNDLLGGQLQLSMPTIPGGLPFVQAGRLRGLAVTSAQRSPAAPDLPTLAEAGVPGYEATNWYGIAAPARTPRAVVDKLNAETGRILRIADVRARLLNLGMDPMTHDPDEFARFLRAEVDKWGKVVRSAGVRLD